MKAEKVRKLVREELARCLPPPRPERRLLTIPECMRRYRTRRDLIFDLIRAGTLRSVYRARGKNGRPQYLIPTEAAEGHPQLGGLG
jgi:hypothetical protein